MFSHVYSMMAIVVAHKNDPSRNAHAPLHCLNGEVRFSLQNQVDLGGPQFRAVLTRDAIIVQSSHQKGADEILLASSRAATASVAAMTLTTLPTHSFHAKLSSGGKDIAAEFSIKQANVRRKDRLQVLISGEQ